MPEATDLCTGHSPSYGAALSISQPGVDCSSCPAPWLSSDTGRLFFNLTDTLLTPRNQLGWQLAFSLPLLDLPHPMPTLGCRHCGKHSPLPGHSLQLPTRMCHHRAVKRLASKEINCPAPVPPFTQHSQSRVSSPGPPWAKTHSLSRTISWQDVSSKHYINTYAPSSVSICCF